MAKFSKRPPTGPRSSSGKNGGKPHRAAQSGRKSESRPARGRDSDMKDDQRWDSRGQNKDKNRDRSKPQDDQNRGRQSQEHKFSSKGSRFENGVQRAESRGNARQGHTQPDKQREPRGPRLRADLFGFHAVREAWRNPGRYVHALYITDAAMKEFGPDLETAAKRPPPLIVSREELDRAFAPGTVHQGIALSVQPLPEMSAMDIVIRAQEKNKSVVVMLDQVTDPHNIGAILRSACAFGADGVIMQSRHAPEMTGILAKTACGALEHIPVAYETNLSRTLEKLKDNGYTVIGLDEHSDKTFASLPHYERVVIVLGAEGPGIRRLIREHCDVLVTLPTKPPIASLNVSNAAAVALYALTA